MKLVFRLLLLSCFFFATTQKSLAQSLRQQLVTDWERAKAYTQEYLNVVPADKYNFRPTDSVRTFAEQMLHFARSNAGLTFIATGIQSKDGAFFMRDIEKSASTQSKDSVLFYVNASYDAAINAIKNMDTTKLTEVVSWDMPGGKRTATRLGWLLKAFEHQTHHRGQCTVYIRLLGIRPPAEKLF
jgi:uncharacterized damage-inducible protein DinB